MVNNALIRFSKEFNLSVESDEILYRLIEEISKLKKQLRIEKKEKFWKF